MPVYGGFLGGLAAGIGGHDEHTRTAYLVAAAGDRVANTADQTTHATTHVFAPGDLAVGDQVDITAIFDIVSAHATNTLTVWGYVGGTVVLGSNVVDPTNSGQALSWDASLFVTSIGASGNVHALGGRGMTYYPQQSSPQVDIAADMSANLTLDFRTQWSAANADNIVDLRALYVTVHRYR